ncbi:MAG: HAD-IIB family hydrolase [Minisyncoccia bacterium]
MIPKKVIVCDLDGTLAPSKSPISSDMAEVIGHVLERYYMAIVSGGSFVQFEKQFLSNLKVGPKTLKNLSLFPTNGSACYVYDEKNKVWSELYEEKLSIPERKKIISALNNAISEVGLDLSGSYGETIEDRGTQITFSGKGQNAPLSIKQTWDPEQTKRRKILEILNKKIPEFDARIGGVSSIDITRKGLDKAYAIGKIKELLKVDDEDIIYVGDALYRGGNDETVKSTGVDFIQQFGPNHTIEFLSRYM